MNIKTILSLAFVGTLILSSCKNESADVQQITEEPSTEMPASQMSEPMESEMQEPAQQQMQEPSSMPQNITPAPATSQRLNPEHGMPNHRCDIQVGAPLNSPAGKPAPQAVTTPVQQTLPGAPSILNAPTSNTAVGMNPPHGQPGHKCDVAVGAPL